MRVKFLVTIENRTFILIILFLSLFCLKILPASLIDLSLPSENSSWLPVNSSFQEFSANDVVVHASYHHNYSLAGMTIDRGARDSSSQPTMANTIALNKDTSSSLIFRMFFIDWTKI